MLSIQYIVIANTQLLMFQSDLAPPPPLQHGEIAQHSHTLCGREAIFMFIAMYSSGYRKTTVS